MCDMNINDLGLRDTNSACMCGTGSPAHTDSAVPAHAGTVDTGDDVIRAHYSVQGMTCEHCVSSVTEELSAVDGIDSVGVKLNVGGASQVMVVSSKPVPVDSVRAAVTEAGYELVMA